MALDMGLCIDSGSSIVSFTDTVDSIVPDKSYLPVSVEDDREWVREEIRLVLVGGLANIRDTISKIERTLNLAREYYDAGELQVVNLYGKLDAAESYYYSDIRGGYLTRHDYDMLSDGKASVTLILERRNYWYGASVSLSLARNAEVAPFEISNCNDGASTGHGARYNWVQVDTSSLAGDLPALTEININPADPSVINMGRLMIFHGVDALSGSSSYTSEGDPGMQIGGMGASYSGQNHIRNTLNGTYYEFPGGPPACGGTMTSRFGFIGRFAPTKPSVALDYYLKTSAWSMPVKRVVFANQLMFLGATPASPVSSGGAAEPVILVVKTADGSTQTLDADFMAAPPMDGWVIIDVMSSGYNFSSVRYDGAKQQSSCASASFAAGTNFYRGFEGPGISLVPGRTNRLYFVWDLNNRAFDADDYVTITVSARPRRRTL